MTRRNATTAAGGHRRSGVTRPLTDFERWNMREHRASESSARNLSTALDTVLDTITEEEILTGDIVVLVDGMPVLDTGEPHLSRRGNRYRRAATVYRQYLEHLLATGAAPEDLQSIFLSKNADHGSHAHPDSRDDRLHLECEAAS